MLKYVNTLSYANTIQIKIDYIPEPIVTELACESYNDYHRNDGRTISLDRDEEFVERIKKNYIRHELTNYDDILSEVRGRLGYGEAYETLKNRVSERIDETWGSQSKIITSEEWDHIVEKVLYLYNYKYITADDLKKRGWSNSIIKNMRLRHDKQLIHPYYTDKAPISLYAISGVEELEDTDLFKELSRRHHEEQEAYQKRELQKKMTYEALEREKSDLFDYIDNVNLEIRLMSEPLLTEKACNSYNYLHIYERAHVSIYDDEDILRDIRKNYILHTLTNYDEIVSGLKTQMIDKKVRKVIEMRLVERIEKEWCICIRQNTIFA